MRPSPEQLASMEQEFRELSAALYAAESGSPDFLRAFAGLRTLAERGYLEVCDLLAELQALEPAVYDPAESYKWYYIALKQRGFSTDYRNESGSEDHYLGPVGDFRNEGMVADMIRAIGLVRISALDAQTEAWLRNHGL